MTEAAAESTEDFVSDTDNAYDTIAKLRAGIAIEREKRHTAEAALDEADDKIAELRDRLDRTRHALKVAEQVAQVADHQTNEVAVELGDAQQEIERLRASIEAESPAEALIFALTDRDNARREATMQRERAERAERREQELLRKGNL